MHEMGIAMEIAEIAVSSIPDTISEPEIAAVHLKVGKLSAVVPASLEFCFAIAAREMSALKNSKLVIEEIPVTLQCVDCHHKWEIAQPYFRCPECDSSQLTTLSGRELEITSIEIAE